MTDCLTLLQCTTVQYETCTNGKSHSSKASRLQWRRTCAQPVTVSQLFSMSSFLAALHASSAIEVPPQWTGVGEESQSAEPEPGVGPSDRDRVTCTGGLSGSVRAREAFSLSQAGTGSV